MRKIYFLLLWLFLSSHASVYAGDSGVLGGTTVEKIRTWDIHSEDIPKILQWSIDYLMGFAATIAIIFIIVWGYKIALWSLEWEKSEWKKTIFLALGGFVLASVSWLILKLIIDNFS